jgi:segregation and condensation protein A
MAEYKVKFEVFEGPLDLLLYLIKKEEVDIYEVNLTRLATQFIEYIDTSACWTWRLRVSFW